MVSLRYNMHVIVEHIIEMEQMERCKKVRSKPTWDVSVRSNTIHG